MSKNSSRTEQAAVHLIDRILALDAENPQAIKGSALGLLKEAKRVLLKDIRRRRDGRERELAKRGME